MNNKTKIIKCLNKLCPNAGNCCRAEDSPFMAPLEGVMYEYSMSARGVECPHHIPITTYTTGNTPPRI